MPSDTKLACTPDPGRLVSDAPWSWDTGSSGLGAAPDDLVPLAVGARRSAVRDAGRAGMDRPPAVARHAARGGGLGVRWLARWLGLPVAGALVAALIYQLAVHPSLRLPDVAHASPWAALGWLIGLTLLAAQRGGWRHPAIIAILLATVGAPNATAILMMRQGPCAWLRARHHPARYRLAAGAGNGRPYRRLAPLTALWWMSMLSVQGRYGADVLGYSESLEAVSATARAETIRGMGYWLAYVRDPFAATTTAALDRRRRRG